MTNATRRGLVVIRPAGRARVRAAAAARLCAAEAEAADRRRLRVVRVRDRTAAAATGRCAGCAECRAGIGRGEVAEPGDPGHRLATARRIAARHRAAAGKRCTRNRQNCCCNQKLLHGRLQNGVERMSMEGRTPSTFLPRAILKNKDHYQINKSLFNRKSVLLFFVQPKSSFMFLSCPKFQSRCFLLFL